MVIGANDATAAPKNRLAESTSPYLRQHANNSVAWWEWGPEALARAQAENKPILLSVGYSACHWCHVMAHESFENDTIAGLMNDRFVNIKVDREERPDIDGIYQKVVQLMGQGGGWPLTVFLTPDQQPFYGGTYFPPTPMYGRPSFPQVLVALSEMYKGNPDKVQEQAEAFMEGLGSLAAMLDREGERVDRAALTDVDVLGTVARLLGERIDETWGGFGREPKFPNPTALEVLALAGRTDEAIRDKLLLTLDKMAQGGIYDHLRGGFARYSVDRVWLVPHFEKMLYDNAQLLPLYAEAAALAPTDQHRRDVVRRTVEYLEADMRAPDGTYYSATDADSEGEEGKYFCWTPAEVREVVADERAAALLCAVYDVSEAGNFEHGGSILHLSMSWAEQAHALGITVEALREQLRPAEEALLRHRYTRVPPLRDEKVLTSWNALLASGLVRAAIAVSTWDDALAERCTMRAREIVDRLLEAHVQGDGRIEVLRAAFEGRVHIRAMLDDVAFLARACLDLHEVTLEPRYAERAAALANHAVEAYATERGDGFYFTAADAEALIERTESQHDGPIPSGVGVMIEVLLRLDAAGRSSERARVESILHRYRAAIREPFAYASVITAAVFGRADARHVTLRGPSPDDPALRRLAALVRTHRLRLPYAVSLSFEPAESTGAVVCQGQVCSALLTDPAELQRRMG